LWLLTLALLLPGSRAAAQSPDPVLALYETEVEAAVDKALTWLAAQQRDEGFFPQSRGQSCGIVSLVAMAFLSNGYTPGAGPHGELLNRCVDWVTGNQQGNGMLNHSAGDKGMYSHNIATLFLAEVSGMVDTKRQAVIDKVLPRAVAVILTAQNLGEKDHRHVGGWRYTPNSTDSDLSCSGWAIMALRSARLNGAQVPDEAILAAVNYLFRNHDKHGGSFGYQDGFNHASTLTGAALLCLELTGHHDHPSSQKAGDYLIKKHRNIPQQQFAFYGVYYGAQASFQRGGKTWETFGKWMYKTYLPKQKEDGTWRSHRKIESDVYYTALMTLSFTVPYRQLPIYQRETIETAEEP